MILSKCLQRYDSVTQLGLVTGVSIFTDQWRHLPAELSELVPVELRLVAPSNAY